MRFSADVLVGIRRFRPQRADVEDFTGAMTVVSLQAVPGGRATIELTGERDVSLSFWDDNSHFVREGGSTSLLFAVTREIHLGGDLSFHQHTYPTETTVALEDGTLFTGARDDQLLGYGGRLDFGLGRGGSIRARVGWFERDSNFDQFDIVGLTLQFGYSVAY